jgi:hypothetical protein
MRFGDCWHYDPWISHNFIQTMLMYKLLLESETLISCDNGFENYHSKLIVYWNQQHVYMKWQCSDDWGNTKFDTKHVYPFFVLT